MQLFIWHLIFNMLCFLFATSHQVKNKGELYKALDDYNVGDKVTLKIQRGGENMDLPVMLEEISSWQGLQISILGW